MTGLMDKGQICAVADDSPLIATNLKVLIINFIVD